MSAPLTRSFYDAQRTISYAAPLTLIITMRSRGKTYGLIKAAIKDYVRDRAQFIWVRRYDSELKATAPKLLDAMIEHREFPDYEFRMVGYTAQIRPKAPMIDGEPWPWDDLGYCIPLSKQAAYKGVEYPRVKKIIFDEFIRVLKTPPGYLRDDVGAFLDLYKTVSRDRAGVYAYLLGNACDLTNPYFAFLGIKTEPKSGFTWHKRKSVLIHYEHDEVFAAEERLTTVGKLVEGTPYSAVMIDNVFANAGGVFIEQKSKAAKFRYGFAWQGWRFGVWIDLSEGLFYITDSIPKGEAVFTLSASDMRPNLIMIDRASPIIKNLSRIFGSGALRFDAEATRERWLKMMQLTGMR